MLLTDLPEQRVELLDVCLRGTVRLAPTGFRLRAYLRRRALSEYRRPGGQSLWITRRDASSLVRTAQTWPRPDHHVEGIEHDGNNWTSWGGNLSAAGAAPVVLSVTHRVV